MPVHGQGQNLPAYAKQKESQPDLSFSTREDITRAEADRALEKAVEATMGDGA